MSTASSTQRHLHIFLCHSSGDKNAVRDLYRRLVNSGFKPWLDENDMLPGQKWEIEIPMAVRNSDVVLACLSRSSVNKEGYVQKEIKFALDMADEKPDGTIYLIPVRLEECKIPDRLSRLHWVNLYESGGYEKLLLALQKRADQVGLNQKDQLSTLRKEPFPKKPLGKEPVEGNSKIPLLDTNSTRVPAHAYKTSLVGKIVDVLLTISQKRLRALFTVVIVPALIFAVSWFGWSTNYWQIHLMRRDLESYGKSLKDNLDLRDITNVYAAYNDLQSVPHILEQTDDPLYKTQVLSAIATSAVKLGDEDKAEAVLDDAINITKTEIKESTQRAKALKVIANSSIRLRDKEKMRTAISSVLELLKEINYQDEAFDVLRTIATLAGELKDKDNGLAILDEVLSNKSTGTIISKVLVLTTVATSAVKLGNEDKAEAVLGDAMSIAKERLSVAFTYYVLRSIAISAGDSEEQRQGSNVPRRSTQDC